LLEYKIGSMQTTAFLRYAVSCQNNPPPI